jgi:hypothetical protein
MNLYVRDVKTGVPVSDSNTIAPFNGKAFEIPKAPLPARARPRHLRHWSDRKGLPKYELAIFAAAVIEGTAILPEMGVEQIATLLGVSHTYINAASKLSPEERSAVLLQRRPLIQPSLPCLPAPSLMEAWDAASPDERRALIRSRPDAVYQAI